ncbi:MAG TPA: hypothetical protein VLR90_24050 [Blastocatellia bacterium]|nr:hypothetical protein [Blastocatellia bacterium]
MVTPFGIYTRCAVEFQPAKRASVNSPVRSAGCGVGLLEKPAKQATDISSQDGCRPLRGLDWHGL